jgi:cobalt-zinc-cadmium efflux system outer membrane protein
MSFRWVAFTAAVILFCEFASAQAPRVLSLDSAFARALEKNPELARLDSVREGARATRDAESQSPPLRLELELENAPRSDQDSSFDSAETTLSLASVFERGGKREARAAAAGAQLNALELQGEQRRADLLAEVARRYLDVVAVQSMADLADAEVKQRKEVLTATTQRVRAGATPDSVRLAAEAALARATLQRERLRTQGLAAGLRLSLLWQSRAPDFERASGDILTIPLTPTLASLRDLIERSPELRRFADESRLREARLQLARSARATDIDWRAGVRRLEEDGSWAAVFGISVPIGNSSRAEPRMRAAQADLAALTFEREAEELSLEATLVEAHMRLSGASAEVTAARDILLPKFAQAESASERAFRAGALSYTEWAQLQSEAMTARREQLLAAVEAHRALIEIQRLTGSPFVTRNQP